MSFGIANSLLNEVPNYYTVKLFDATRVAVLPILVFCILVHGECLPSWP